jgi:hypothetical protein
MDSTRFDGLIRNLGSTLDRRTAARGLFAGALATAIGGAVLDEASAKRRRKRRKKKNQTGSQGGGQTLRPGDFCQRHNQCPPSYICEVAVNAGNSDRTCCGAQGAGCGAKNEDGDDTAPFCCVGHACVFNPGNGSWTCQVLPDDGL